MVIWRNCSFDSRKRYVTIVADSNEQEMKETKALKIKLPATVKAILDSLHAAGFEAYAVGGCIRDSILGRRPDDWDITTSARPEQVKEIFNRTVDTGIAHGTVTVLSLIHI